MEGQDRKSREQQDRRCAAAKRTRIFGGVPCGFSSVLGAAWYVRRNGAVKSSRPPQQAGGDCSLTVGRQGRDEPSAATPGRVSVEGTAAAAHHRHRPRRICCLRLPLQSPIMSCGRDSLVRPSQSFFSFSLSVCKLVYYLVISWTTPAEPKREVAFGEPWPQHGGRCSRRRRLTRWMAVACALEPLALLCLSSSTKKKLPRPVALELRFLFFFF
jgi:hypothetical protein